MRVTFALALTGLLFARPMEYSPPDLAGGSATAWSFGGWLVEDPADSLYRSAQNALSGRWPVCGDRSGGCGRTARGVPPPTVAWRTNCG